MSTDLIPAIDLRGGQCVRLHQGDFSQETRYDADPIELARSYAQAGATRLHVVDLDGARSGRSEQADLIGEMQRASGLPVQTGGGLRGEEQIQALLGAGAARVVVGTTVVKQPQAFGGWLKTYGADRVVAALDVRAGDDGQFYPATAGWTEAGDQTLDTLLDTLSAFGLEHLLCTDISRDGTLSGPNLELYEALVARGLKVQASGGVSNLSDLTALKAIGVDGIIVGKALLEGRQVDVSWVSRVARVIDIPFCVAGGIRSVAQAGAVLEAGADKISVNTPALENPDLISDLARAFGSQCVVVGIDSLHRDGVYTVKQNTGNPDLMSDANRSTEAWLSEAQQRGAGEFVLNCMNSDGARSGYDIRQLRLMREASRVPLIASGGAGTMQHFLDVFREADVDGALAATVFHSGAIPIPDLKSFLRDGDVLVRP